MIESAIYYFLRKYFRSESYYVDIMDLMHEVTFQTELGQQLDLLIAPETHVDLDKFSLDKHEFIITYKTAFYSFYLPVALAMYMAGVSDERDLKAAESVLIALGQYFQVQDDYLDCYGDPAVIGKIGTDIFDNKCSWLINKALQKATPEQRAILDANYGRKSSENEARVKEVFLQLDLKHDYEVYEEDIVARIRTMIDGIDESRGFKREVLTEFLNKIYKRSK